MSSPESVLSKLKSYDFKKGCLPDDLPSFLEDFEVLLATSEGKDLLKQPNKNFEVLLPVFANIIFCDDSEVAKRLFKYFDAVNDIFRSKLPKIKKSDWWKKFELEHLVKSIPKLTQKIAASDDSWVEIWSFTANLIICDTALSTAPLNALLSISETSFRKGKEHPEILDQAWRCWVALIDAFGRSPKILLPSKTLSLLLKPLLACCSVSKLRVSTWIHLIEVKGITSSDDTVKQLVESFCKAMYLTPGEKAICRHLPQDCAAALIKLLSYKQVVDNCLENIIGVFGNCLSSRPMVGSIEKLSQALVKAINDNENDTVSFKLWKMLLEQYKTCNESPIISQACEIIFTEVNFQRWVDSGVIDSKNLNELLCCSEFRNKVLLRSISAAFTAVDGNASMKNNRKSSNESAWNNYCEALISWWSNECPSPPKENERNSSEFSAPSRDGHDFKAMLALVLYPFQVNLWNPTVSKTWTRVCETCQKHRLLHLMFKQIVDALYDSEGSKIVDVLSILSGIDTNFIKSAHRILDALPSKLHSLEPKQIMDLLTFCEIALTSADLSSAINEILKNVTEFANAQSDQLTAHKLRTKVGKLSRKLEQLNSSEKDKPTKAQRTPFRTQSNFLQRLAKAEEKNKTKVTYLSPKFSPSEKPKNDEGAEIENGISEVASLDVTNFSDDPGSKKSLKLLDGSENVSIVMPLMSPSIMKEALSAVKGENKDSEVTVAEKENVILPSSTASPIVSSPANKMKITNARELRIVDPSSPTTNKKSKPVAGQKITPKKTSSVVVSYFDDDANDCVMVPPKPKTTPLTEHQMEMMTKRRTDIPAMYQDLSQDTQISNPPSSIIQEMKNGVREEEEGEEIVESTPSPKLPTTPECSKSSAHKKLDFNSVVSTPPKQANPCVPHGDVPLKSPDRQLQTGNSVSAAVESVADKESDLIKPLPTENGSVDHEEKEDVVPMLNTANDVKGEQPAVKTEVNTSPSTPKKIIKDSVDDEKPKRKRKSEPTKFSPKQTRSKKSLKNVTPESKLSKSLISDSSVQVKNGDDVNKTEVSKCEKSDNKPIASSDSLIHSTMEVNGEVNLPSNDVNPVEEQITGTPAVEKSTPSRKRKCNDVPNADDPKKSKLTDEETPTKKTCKMKRKKIFKLNSGNNNLENWLVKTERVSNTNSPSSCSIKSEEVDSEGVTPGCEVTTANDVCGDVDLNNSEEIVPSTQETDIASIIKTEAFCEAQEGKKDDCTDSVKEEGSEVPRDSESTQELMGDKCIEIIEKTNPELPNCDLDLIIRSPSKRQRRAQSVLRGEGDTYLSKDKFWQDESEEGIRGKNSSPSSQSKKRIYPPGGRSAKMLRLATSSTLSDEDGGVTTPVRKRENIVPISYGENWPTGPTEDWVACTPMSPCTSPFKGVLKRTPSRGDECQVTPQRLPAESLASPLLSSAKRKRVMFLDPPVTKGLIYQRDSPFGALHLADVPAGSPYPTWKSDENASSKQTLQSKLEDAALNGDVSNEKDPDLITTILEDVSVPVDEKSNVDETQTPVETSTIPSYESDYANFKIKHGLDDDFIQTLSHLDLSLRALLIECFGNDDMEEIINGWKIGDGKKIAELPHNFLGTVKNEKGQHLFDVLKSIGLIPTVKEIPATVASGCQTNVPITHSGCQTCLETKSTETNTTSTEFASASTQTWIC